MNPRQLRQAMLGALLLTVSYFGGLAVLWLTVDPSIAFAVSMIALGLLFAPWREA